MNGSDRVRGRGVGRGRSVVGGVALGVVLGVASGAWGGELVTMHAFNLDEDPGWTTEGMWAWGEPTGEGGTQFGHPDPTSGATGLNVYGYNLEGDYPIEIGGPYWLTTTAMDCTGYEQVTLQFERWLNTDWLPWVRVAIEASNDGATWTVIWENGFEEIVSDAWETHAYDISAVADGQPTVYVRWGHEVLEGGTWAYSGWNIDDIMIMGMEIGQACPADLDGNGDVAVDDLLALLGAWGTDGVGSELAMPMDVVDVDDLLVLLGAWGACE